MALQQAGFEWINKGLDSFIGGINKANEAIQQSGKKSSQSGESFSALGGIVTGASMAITNQLINAGKAVVGFAKDSIGMAASFEGAASRLKIAGTGAAAQAGISLETLADAALKVGDDTRLMGVSATGAAAAMTNLLKAGLPLSDIMGDLNGYMNEGAELGGVLAASIQLAAASELDMVQASTLASTTMTIFGLSSEKVVDAMDYIVRGADASVSSVTDLKDGLEGTGPTLRALGFSIEDAVDALALLSNAGMSGAEAGTALRSAFSTMASDKKKVVAAFNEVGMSITNADGSFKSFREILILTEEATKSMTEAQKRQFLTTISGHYGQTAMNALINQGVAGYDRYTEALGSAAGMQSQASTMATTFGARMEALQGNIETLRIEIGSQFLPVGTELIGIFSQLVQNYGPQMVDTATKIADSMLQLINIITNLPPWLTRSSLEIGGLATATLLGAGAVMKLIPVIHGLIPVMTAVVASIKLYTGGVVLAEGATMAWAVAIVPIGLAIAALVASIVAVNMAIDLHKDIVEKTAEVTDAWTGYLQEQAEKQTTATGVAQAYLEKQQDVNKAYEEGGIVAQLFIDKQKVMNADTEVLNKTLADSATNYDDYLAAVQSINAEVRESSKRFNQYGKEIKVTDSEIEGLVQPLSESAFWISQNSNKWLEYHIALRDARMGITHTKDALVQVTQVHWSEYANAASQSASQMGDAMQAAAVDSQALFTALSSGLSAARAEVQPLDQSMLLLQQAIGGTTSFVEEQNSALLLLSLAYDQGVITADQYVAGGQQVMSVTEESAMSLYQLQRAVTNTTDGFFALDDPMNVASGTMAQVANQAMLVAQAQEEMAARAKAAWETFEGNVRTGVEGALNAYKAGNAEMLAEQQANLAAMLWNQTDQMLAMGQITVDQAMEMRTALTDEFGPVVDEVALTTSALTTLFADFAAGGTTSAGEVVAFITNIGENSATLKANAEADILAQIEQWNNLQANIGENATGIGTHSEMIAERIDTMALNVDGSATTTTTAMTTMTDEITASINTMADDVTTRSGDIVTEFGTMGTEAGTMATQVEGASTIAVSAIDDIAKAIDNLPDYKRIEIEIEKTGDTQFDFNSPDFKVYYALERLMALAREGVEVPIVGTDMMPAAPVSMPMMTRDVNNSRSVVVEVNANYANAQSEASIYYDVVAALSGARI